MSDSTPQDTPVSQRKQEWYSELDMMLATFIAFSQLIKSLDPQTRKRFQDFLQDKLPSSKDASELSQRVSLQDVRQILEVFLR